MKSLEAHPSVASVSCHANPEATASGTALCSRHGSCLQAAPRVAGTQPRPAPRAAAPGRGQARADDTGA